MRSYPVPSRVPPKPPPLAPPSLVTPTAGETLALVAKFENHLETEEDEAVETTSVSPTSGGGPPKRPPPKPPAPEDLMFLLPEKSSSSFRPQDRVKAMSKANETRTMIMKAEATGGPTDGGVRRNSTPEMELQGDSPMTPSLNGAADKHSLLASVMQQVQKLNKPDWKQLNCPKELITRFKTSLSKREGLSLADGIRDSCHLIYLAHEIMLSFPPDALMPRVLKDYFVQAALIDDDSIRRRSLHSLLWCLPEKQISLLRSLFDVVSRFVDAQLIATTSLFVDVFYGSALLSERLARDWAIVSNHAAPGTEVVFGTDPVSLLACSGTGLVNMLLDRFYDLLEADFLEMAAVVFPYVLSDVQLIEALHERYSALVVGTEPWQHEYRKRILFVVHQFLLQHRAKFSDEFSDALSSFKMALHEDGKEDSMIHVLFILRFSLDDASNGMSPEASIPTVESVRTLSYSVTDWANALTHAAHKLFLQVNPSECVCRNWEDPSKSPNFSRLTAMFNSLQTYVAAQILQTEDRAEALVIMEHFIQIGSALVAMKNFHSAFAVFAGLSMTSIQRLKALWSKVEPKKIKPLFEEMQALFSPSKNHQTYQKALDACKNVPVVPNMIIFIKWLFAIEEANATKRDDGMLNMLKMRMIFSITRRIETLKRAPVYMLPINEELSSFVEAIPQGPTEDELYQLSLQREARSDNDKQAKLSLRDSMRGAFLRKRTASQTKSVTPSAMRASGSASQGGASPTSAVIKKFTCPVCVEGFDDKESLLEHIPLCKH